jgi:hypothetical protein
METITRNEYLFHLKKIDKREFIDENQYSDRYVKLGGAYCGLHHQKNKIVQINGLFSLEKGDGSKLVKKLQRKYQYLRLNCLGDKLESYYRKLGFKTYLHLRVYREMLWKRD